MLQNVVEIDSVIEKRRNAEPEKVVSVIDFKNKFTLCTCRLSSFNDKTVARSFLRQVEAIFILDKFFFVKVEAVRAKNFSINHGQNLLSVDFLVFRC